MQKQIHHLMRKEMSRKEFLATLGFGIATIAGFSTLLQLLGKRNPWQSQGYGSSAYGGNSDTRKG